MNFQHRTSNIEVEECLTGGHTAFRQTDSAVEVDLTDNPVTVDTIVEMTLESSAAGIKPIATAVPATTR